MHVNGGTSSEGSDSSMGAFTLDIGRPMMRRQKRARSMETFIQFRYSQKFGISACSHLERAAKWRLSLDLLLCLYLRLLSPCCVSVSLSVMLHVRTCARACSRAIRAGGGVALRTGRKT